MGVPSSAALVKYIASLVEDPELLKEEGCLHEVTSYLDSQLEHSDEVTRLGAAKALTCLKARLPGDEWRSVQLVNAPKVLSKLRTTDSAEDPELKSLLSVVMGTQVEDSELCQTQSEGSASRADTTAVNLAIAVEIDDVTKRSIRHALIQTDGVVSVTFENNVIVVTARRHDTDAEEDFVRSLRTVANAVRPELFNGANASTQAAEDAPSLDYLDDGEDEPVYLDDEDDDITIPYIDQALGSTLDYQFTKNADLSKLGAYWMTSRKLEDCWEDPTLTARFQRARARVERQRKEEQSRLRLVLSVITPSRAAATVTPVAGGIE